MRKLWLSVFLIPALGCQGASKTSYANQSIPAKQSITLPQASAQNLVQVAPSGLILVKLDTLWRIDLGPDATTTSSPQERDAHSTSGALYYVPASTTDVYGNPLPKVNELYRLINITGTDHMDSNTMSVSNYHVEGPLSYMFASPSAFPGLVPILEAYDGVPGTPNFLDHALLRSGDFNHPAESLPNYSVEGTLGYGYARHLSEAESLVSVSGGGVTVKSNANAGGAVWEWWWNNIEFINDYDYGRQLSMAVYPPNISMEETGDGYSSHNTPIYARHPSPTLFVQTTGSFQSSLAVPVDWSPENHGGDSDHPVVYSNVKIGKNLALNWIGPDGVNNNWPVALYESVYQGPALAQAFVEAPTAYINTQFTNYYKYDPASDTLTVLNPAQAVVDDVSLATPTAIIISTADQSAAMGVYINDPNAGLVVYKNNGPDGGQYGSSFAKWGVVYNTSVSANWKFRTWIATDTVANLKTYIKKLYLWNVTSRDNTGKWDQIPGGLSQVSVGSASEIWGVNPAGHVYQYNGNNGWNLMPGNLKQVSVAADGEVWGVSSTGSIFRHSGNGQWSLIPGNLEQISVGSSANIWGVNSAGQIYQYNGKNGWNLVSGSLKQISVGADGEVWGVAATGAVYRHSSGGTWSNISSPSFTEIAVGSVSNIWALSSSGQVFQYDSGHWTQAPGYLKEISAASDATVWGVDSPAAIFKYNKSGL